MRDGGDGLERMSFLNFTSGRLADWAFGGVFGAEPQESVVGEDGELCLTRVKTFCNSSNR